MTAERLDRALRAYALTVDSVSFLKQGSFCEVYRFDVRVVGVMSPAYGALWPRHLAPVDSVPTINDRVLDVAPYIDHDPQAGDDVSVKGWVEVGRMVGRMHRLGSSVIDRAAVALPYGNHPHDALLFGYFDRMKARTQSEHLL